MLYLCKYVIRYCSLKSNYYDVVVLIEFTKTTLTPLEIELRDELRKVADDMDAMVSSFVNAMPSTEVPKTIMKNSIDFKFYFLFFFVHIPFSSNCTFHYV